MGEGRRGEVGLGLGGGGKSSVIQTEERRDGRGEQTAASDSIISYSRCIRRAHHAHPAAVDLPRLPPLVRPASASGFDALATASQRQLVNYTGPRVVSVACLSMSP